MMRKDKVHNVKEVNHLLKSILKTETA